MKIQDTTATKKIFQLNKRIRAIAGGTSASKTISILIWLIDYALSVKGELITVVSQTFNHLSGGAMADFEMVMKDRGYWKDSQWVKNPKPTYTFGTGTRIEFISIDTVGKAHGPRRDILFINECNNLSYEIADQLIVRTRKVVWMDWNPVSEFWFYTELHGKRDDIDFIKLTYLDNEALDLTTKNEIESRRHKRGWWKVYGEGELGEAEGRIYTGWNIVDEVPFEARLERHWVDFGYSNDPTAIGDIHYYNGGYILDEQCYQKGLSNKQIADVLLNLKSALTIADSAEPKSIDEIRMFGVNIMAATKGPDSVRHGISSVQDQQISVTRRSINLLKEYQSYLWAFDKDGRPTGEPEGIWNHHMDGIRYAMSSLLPMVQRKQIMDNMPRLYRQPKKNPAR